MTDWKQFLSPCEFLKEEEKVTLMEKLKGHTVDVVLDLDEDEIKEEFNFLSPMQAFALLDHLKDQQQTTQNTTQNQPNSSNHGVSRYTLSIHQEIDEMIRETNKKDYPQSKQQHQTDIDWYNNSEYGSTLKFENAPQNIILENLVHYVHKSFDDVPTNEIASRFNNLFDVLYYRDGVLDWQIDSHRKQISNSLKRKANRERRKWITERRYMNNNFDREGDGNNCKESLNPPDIPVETSATTTNSSAKKRRRNADSKPEA